MNSYPSLSSLISTKIVPNYDYLAKIIIVGPSNCGKTSLLNYFINGPASQNTHFFNQTINVEFKSKLISIGEHNLKLQIWDTAGQERFRSITRNYYRDSAGVILIYDVNNKQSFVDLKDFMSDVVCLINLQTVSIVLFGNKTDLLNSNPIHNNEVVSDKLVTDFIDDYSDVVHITWLKGSVAKGQNCTECFSSLSRSIVTKLELGVLDGISNGLQIGDMSAFSDYGSVHNGKSGRIGRISVSTPTGHSGNCCC